MVSVIVPVYNEEQYLQKCIDSICNQTLKELEIICIDDGSTDGSLRILQSAAEKDSRIRILTQNNLYAGRARNVGMKYASGKYLSFLDADDYFEPDMLEKMFYRAEEDNSDVVICKYEYYCEKTHKVFIRDWSFVDSFIHQKEGCSKNTNIFQITNGWAWDKLFRTDYVKYCGYKFSDFRSSEDGFFVYMLVARARKISYMDDVLLTHRINCPDSLSNTKEKDWPNGFKMLMLIFDELKGQNIYDIYQQSFLNKTIDFLSWYLESMHSFEAYKNCYTYIWTDLEPIVEVLAHGREYYFQKDLYDWYCNVNSLSFEEYLFQKKERDFEIMTEQKEIMQRQKMIALKQSEALRERDWVFPFRLFEKGKTIVIYGAGKIGSTFYSQLMESQFCKEVIWVDRNFGDYVAKGVDVQDPVIVFKIEFDYIFLAIKNKNTQEEVQKYLLQEGIHPGKIRCYGTL